MIQVKASEDGGITGAGMLSSEDSETEESSGRESGTESGTEGSETRLSDGVDSGAEESPDRLELQAERAKNRRQII